MLRLILVGIRLPIVLFMKSVWNQFETGSELLTVFLTVQRGILTQNFNVFQLKLVCNRFETSLKLAWR